MKDRTKFRNISFSAISRLILTFMLSVLLPASAILNGCGRSGTVYTENGFYFDTVITLTVYSDKDIPVLKECFELCKKYEDLLSRTRTGSDIYRINHSGGTPVSVDPETAGLLKQAVRYAELANGRIDPTVAPLMELWNFTGNAEGSTESIKKEPSGKPPLQSSIDSLLPHVNYKNIQISGTSVTITDTDTRLDLGFIAKGYIADRLKDLLLDRGVSSAMINLGGNVLAVGNKPDGSYFSVGIQKPFSASGDTIAALELRDRSMVASGNYERYFEYEGQIYHHILDAKTGWPVQNNLLSVTILSDSSMTGDALSTTCYVLGLEEGMALIESLDGVEAVFITDDYRLHTSSGLTGLSQ